MNANSPRRRCPRERTPENPRRCKLTAQARNNHRLQLSVQYVRAAVPAVPLVCRARCLNVGRRIGSTEAELTQDGVLVAKATGTHAVLSR